jgi:hypothetical protein
MVRVELEVTAAKTDNVSFSDMVDKSKKRTPVFTENDISPADTKRPKLDGN